MAEKRTTVSTLSHLLMLTWKTKILMTRKTMRLELRSLESSLVQFSQNQLSQETQLQHLLVKRACLGEIIRFCKMLTCHLFTHFSESGSRRGRPPGSTNKRKLSDDPSALKLSKKAKLSEDDEDSPATPEQGVPVLEPSSSGRVRKARKMFDL